jgi:hypothetical protein
MRTHDIVLFDGTFRVVLTPKGRVVAVMNAPETALGPMHVALNIDRAASRVFMPQHRHMETAGIFDDIGKAAENTFNAVSHVATPLARPAFDVLKGATGQAAHLIATSTPLLPHAVRDQIERASQVVMKARLGDLNAKQFIRTIATAAKDGVSAAQHVGNTLLDASKFVARAVDAPMLLATSAVPGLAPMLGSLSPLKHYEDLVSAIQKGDIGALKKMIAHDVSMFQGVASLIPGLGTGISSALGVGMAALEGGHPIEIALRAAYGAIPIPAPIRQITDIVLDTVIAFIEHPNDLTEVGIQVARDRVPAGLPREVFDTLVQLVVKRVPLQKVGASLVDHYVQKYAPMISSETLSRAVGSTPSLRMVQPLMHAHG